MQMRQERARRQEQAGVSRLEIKEAEQSGRMVWMPQGHFFRVG